MDDQNRYTYVGNDPLNATDPDGREILLSTHGVFGSPIQHSKIVIIPKNQAKYAHDARFKHVTPDGRRFATIGAGPQGKVPYFLGKLIGKEGRETDVASTAAGADSPNQDLALPGGMSEDEAISALFNGLSNFQNDSDYSLFPDRSDPNSRAIDYNSNGFANGLLHAEGFSGYDRPAATPGFDIPVPDSAFLKHGTITVTECTPEHPC